MKSKVTEFDLRKPEFQDPKLKPWHFEFDADGEVVRKDRFETGMREVHGVLIDLGLVSARDKWTVATTIDKLKSVIDEANRLKLLIKIINCAPKDAEYFHFINMEYVQYIDPESLQQAKKYPDESLTVNFNSYKLLSDIGWEEDGAWLEYINVLVNLEDIKKEVLILANVEACQ